MIAIKMCVSTTGSVHSVSSPVRTNPPPPTGEYNIVEFMKDMTPFLIVLILMVLIISGSIASERLGDVKKQISRMNRGHRRFTSDEIVLNGTKISLALEFPTLERYNNSEGQLFNNTPLAFEEPPKALAIKRELRPRPLKKRFAQ